MMVFEPIIVAILEVFATIKPFIEIVKPMVFESFDYTPVMESSAEAE